MALADYTSFPLEDFLGPQSLPDSTDVPKNAALLARNVEYLPGQVSSRKGFAQAFSAGATVSAHFNWLSPNGNWWLGYYPGTGVKFVDVASPAAATTIMNEATGKGAKFANAGSRFYASFFDQNGNGAAQAQVYSWGTGADKLFAHPMQYTPSAPTEPGAGTITKGTHRIGYLLETRNGFLGAPSPVNTGNVFQPISFTASGSKNASITLNTTWPAEAGKVHLIMTPVENPNDWYQIPGAEASVPAGGAFSVTIGFDITDEDLIASGIPVNDQFDLLTQAQDGTGPFTPSVIVPYRDRMSYVAHDFDINNKPFGKIYMSDSNAYQQMTVDNEIQLPQSLDITTAFELQGAYYMVGPHWTYSTRDNGGKPATWATPELIDGRKGTLAPKGVEVAPNGSYAWVADQAGLFLFTGGKYPDLPVSYYNTPDWKRINWNVAYLVEVVDDHTNQRVIVKAPLDGATSEATHMLTWDYTNGTTADKVKFSLDNIAGSNLGSVAIFQNDLPAMPTGVPKRLEAWVVTATGAVLRKVSELDSQPYRDGSQPISSFYQGALLPGVGRKVYQHHAMLLRMKGVGTMTPVVTTLDGSKSTGSGGIPSLRTLTLNALPGKEDLLQFDLRSEAVTYTFQMNTLDQYWILSRLEHFYSEWVGHR